MIKIRFETKGTSDLLLDPKTEEILEAIRTGVKIPSGPKISGETKDDTARKKADALTRGNKILLPSIYLKMSLINAGKNKKYKKELGLSVGDGSFVPSLMIIGEEFLPLLGSEKWETDQRAVPNKAGSSNVNVRPRFKDWGFSATLIINDDILNEKIARKLVEEAGVFMGVGAGRKLGFGRFEIVKWEKI